MLLADIGNTHFHIYDGTHVVHLFYEDTIRKYADVPLKYISVNNDIKQKIGHIENWENVSGVISLPNEYETMGVDRKALCLSHDNGMFIDAGSAITVDVMERGIYKGGYILPGIKAMLESYRQISPALDVSLDEHIDLTKLPLTTKEQISYGIIASIKALIEKHKDKKRLYFTGGDGQMLAGFFRDAVYDEALVFKGMQYVLQASEK
ncbi:type III pantothenate kinase [Sulfurovum sp. NBC37-1]|uniref:type III pantothenate kinase n=1 Tax=Sulfurovum sp. (strain NBC37-1) TaxID=387093 RepID=UPI000158785D|nr:type III pantothenate kinase [Sulfurovum sp. NBC37-1]BAF71383.1 transcriptional activator, Baf family [Sulfurovum sp. NBC37-1]